MLKSDLIQRILAQNPHLYHRDIEKLINTILDEIVDALHRGDRVELRGFGALSAKLRRPRKGRNPKTGAEVQVAQKAIPYFKTGKEMRARLNPATEPIVASADQVAKEANLRRSDRTRPNTKEKRSHIGRFHSGVFATVQIIQHSPRVIGRCMRGKADRI